MKQISTTLPNFYKHSGVRLFIETLKKGNEKKYFCSQDSNRRSPFGEN